MLEVFQHLANVPAKVTAEDMVEIERFVIVLYMNTSPLRDVKEARKQLFSAGRSKIDKIPPTKAALCQHV